MYNRLISVWVVITLGFTLFSVPLPVWGSLKVEQAIRAETAEQAVELATGEVLALIEAGKEYADTDPERFYTELEGLLRPMIDFPRFARNVMGPYFKAATPEQQQRFAESFKWSLVRTYALALTEFSNGEVNVLPPRQPPKNPNRVNVTQEIVFEGKAYMVVYRMRRDDAAWRVSNLIVEGINIGLNYKSQFAAAMKDPQYAGDMDAVIDAWVEVIEAEEDDTDDAEQSAGQIPVDSAAPETEQKAAGEALMARSPGPYQFDLGGLQRANSVTVAVLLAWYRHATLRQKSIMFVNLSQDLLNIIEFSGLRRLLIGTSPHHE